MIPLEKKRSISKQDVSRLIKEQYIPLIQAFYESQGSFMSSIYKQYGNLDSGTISNSGCFFLNGQKGGLMHNGRGFHS